MDVYTPASLKKPLSISTGVCEYNGAVKVAITDRITRIENPLRESSMLATIIATCAVLDMDVLKPLAVPKYNDKYATEEKPYEKIYVPAR
jgi:hypothetical protein